MEKTQISTSEYPLYYQKYMERVNGISVIEGLLKGESEMVDFLQAIPKEKRLFRYSAEKWSPKQILLHLVDTERIFSYRAFMFARSEEAELLSYDENLFAENSHADKRLWEELLEEYKSVRKATINLFKSFGEEDLKKHGKVNGNKMSVRAAGYIICGHEIHHREIISERYLNSSSNSGG